MYCQSLLGPNLHVTLPRCYSSTSFWYVRAVIETSGYLTVLYANSGKWYPNHPGVFPGPTYPIYVLVHYQVPCIPVPLSDIHNARENLIRLGPSNYYQYRTFFTALVLWKDLRSLDYSISFVFRDLPVDLAPSLLEVQRLPSNYLGRVFRYSLHFAWD